MTYTTAQILAAIAETRRDGHTFFGKSAVMARKGKWSEPAQRQCEKDLITLGYLKAVAQ